MTEIIPLNDRPDFVSDPKVNNAYTQLAALLDELRTRELPIGVVALINQGVDQLNAVAEPDRALARKIKGQQNKILRMLEKELKIVPKGYYQALWMVLGMSAFGLPLGVAMGMTLGNLAFLASGLPIGIAIGLGIGTGIDNKTRREGRQLNFERKY